MINKIGSTKIVKVGQEQYDVYIGRPSKWENPFTHISDRKTLAKYIVNSRDEAIECYRDYITNGEGKHLIHDLFELKDKTLGCWCYPEKCHGDVLIELVEEYCYDDEKQMLKDKISKHINNKDK